MPVLEVRLTDHCYPVHLGSGCMSDSAVLTDALPGGGILVVTDENVAPLYLDRLRSALPSEPSEVCVLPAGEAHKNLDAWNQVIDRMVKRNIGRDGAVIALGGGVIGDIAGFAAACYMRGVRYLQVPTTLLAQVDSSVGGKTGVNHPLGKNLVGAFHQPDLVVADTDSLSTLPQREYRAGLAEVVKYGVLGNQPFFEWLESRPEAIRRLEPGTLVHMIGQCIQDKAAIVAEDTFEQGRRALLNLGHTFGHAIEQVSGFGRYLHGEAVAIGMVIAARLSEQRGLSPAGTTDRVMNLLRQFELEVTVPAALETRELIEAMGRDKKNRGAGKRLILIHGIGQAVVDDHCNDRQIAKAIDACR
ncbi:MAG: 3-dehydroquinate synthase [Xanthomonadales bacterium]|nr:3-dehydroquinate synthase [Xanthomonadales bacterium]